MCLICGCTREEKVSSVQILTKYQSSRWVGHHEFSRFPEQGVEGPYLVGILWRQSADFLLSNQWSQLAPLVSVVAHGVHC